MKDQSTTIRAATPSDAASILDIYGPYVEETAISFEEQPPTIEEMGNRIAASHLWLVAEDGTDINGYAYGAPFHRRPAYRWSVEVSVYMAHTATGRGIGRRLIGELLEGLRAKGFVSAFAGTTLPNQASIALFESFGFEKIAHQKEVGFKLGAWHDVGWWQLHLNERTVPPPRTK